jgi:predicted PurR-regulated permease PerM
MAEKAPINFNRLLRNILTAVIVALVIFILWYFMSVTMYIICGVILSLIARPLYIQMERIHIKKYKLPSSINALLSILVIWAILGGIGALTIPLIIREGVKVSKTDPEKLITQLEKPINDMVMEMEALGMITFDKNDSVQPKPDEKTIERIIVYKLPCDSIYNSVYNHGGIFEPDVDTLIKTTKTVPDKTTDSVVTTSGIYHRKELEAMIKDYGITHISVQKLTKWFGDAFTAVGNILATIVSASFLAFFFLRDKNLFKNIIITIMPKKYEEQTIAIMTESRRMLSRYFIGLVLELILVMACTTIGLLIIGLNFQLAITIGFFSGLFNIIPYLGPVIGAAVGLMLGIANFLDMDVYSHLLPLIGKMLLVFAIVQILDNNIFQTVIFSNSVKAHPIEIFLVIVLAGSLAGVVGMIFAVPIYTVLRIVGRHFFSQFRIVKELTQNMD